MSQYTAPPSSAATPMNPADEKLWATLTHLGGIFFYFVPALVIFLVLKDRGPFIRHHTISALNFQLTMLLGWIVGYILLFVFIGFFVLLTVAVLVIVFSIIAAVAANKGEWYTYPLSITFVS